MKSSKTAKSLFTGAKKEIYIQNSKQKSIIQSANTRYFRRLLKRKGIEGVKNALAPFAETNLK
jgi:hypothetical protein